MTKVIKRTYSEVWKAGTNEKQKNQRGFEENINNLKKLYSYQRYHEKSCGETGYDEKIIETIKNKDDSCKELKSDFMNMINWIALWKTDRIIEFDNVDDIKTRLENLKNLKESDSFEIEESKETFRSLLEESRGIQLAMASTIMHFYNPNVFPIIDKRAYRAISIIKKQYTPDGKLDMSNITEKPNTIKLESIKATTDDRVDKYYEYIKDCKELMQKLKEAGQSISMKDIDKFLYQIDNLTGFNIKDVPIKSY